jgi:uncharacterized DUF497 family protein
MRLMKRFGPVVLQWEAWNIRHIWERHQVVPRQVEEVFAGTPYARPTYRERFLVVGPTVSGEMMAIVIGPSDVDPNIYQVFSARKASRRERKDYEQQRQAETDTGARE